ncbi:MAG: FHA domain-containing protein [Deltaproteobacteria bacterium]
MSTSPVNVAALFDLLASGAAEVEPMLGGSLLLLPLEPWASGEVQMLRDATLTGRAQLVKTTIGRQAPALEAAPFPLPPSEVIEIGRSHRASLRIDQPTISRLHAELKLVDGKLQVRDRGSYNGTMVNGHVLGPGETAFLAEGDVLTLGESQLLFGSLAHLAALISKK